ncbi:MAG TPA: AsmA-like C-terminal region-containing protein [Gemmataceae bacterium]|nr:AsmA-like C-terminal region-containing protein [Gemmataceae bacterium]
MGWRRLLLHSLVCMGLAGAGVAGYLAYLRINSHAIRRQLIELLESQLQDVDVEVGSAYLRPLGGISVRDLKICRKGEAGPPLLEVPAATIYHDKEQLTHGRLAIRKIELQSPTLRLRRDEQGQWNVARFARSAGKANEAVPTVVVRQGTISYDDRTGGLSRAVLELKHCNWTLINDPAPVLTFQGQAECSLGPIKCQATAQRKDGTLCAQVDLPEFSFGHRTVVELGGHLPDWTEHLRDLQGKGEAHFDVRFQPGAQPEWQPELRLQLHDATLRHPRLPLPLESLQGSVHYSGGNIRLEHCRARSGSTAIALNLVAAAKGMRGAVDSYDDFLEHADLTIQQLALTPELFARLPKSLQELQREFQPAGPLSLKFTFDRDESSWRRHCIVHPEGMTAMHEDFRYPLQNVTGMLDQFTASDGTDRLKVDLKGVASDKPFTIRGQAQGQGDEQKIDLTIQGNDLPLDPRAEAALGPHRALAESFHLRGRADLRVTIQKRFGEPRLTRCYHLDLKNTNLNYDAFPYPLENVTGIVDITSTDRTHWELRNFRGQHHGGEVMLSGKLDVEPSGDLLQLRVEGAGVPLDDDLRKALAKMDLDPAWRVLGPRGRAGFTAHVTHVTRNVAPGRAAPRNEFEVTVPTLRVDSITPSFMPYELNDVSCAFQYVDRVLTFKGAQGVHRASRLRVGPSQMIVKPEGGVWGQFNDVQLVPFIPDDEFIQALPPPLRVVASALQPTGPMSFSTKQLVVETATKLEPPSRLIARGQKDASRRSTRSPAESNAPSPWIFWDDAELKFTGADLNLGPRWHNVYGEFVTRGEYRHGQLGAVLGNVAMEQATVFRQPLRKVFAHLVMDPGRAPEVLQVRDIQGQLFGGVIAGEGRISIKPQLEYNLSLKAIQLRLEDLARHNRLGPDAQISGLANGQIFVSCRDDDIDTLRGGGTIDVPQGRIYDLPLLLDLLKFLKLRAPDGTAFEEGHAKFRIQGQRIRVDQIELLGNLMCLTGEGSMQLNGTNLALDVYPVWSRLLLAVQGPARDVTTTISRNLYKIEMRGSIDGPLDFRQEAVPILVDPVRSLIERTRPPASAMPAGMAQPQAGPRY